MKAAPQLVRAHPGDSRRLAEVIAEAFFPLAPSTWLVPDPEARRNIFTNYFMLYVELGMTEGAIYTTPDRQAAAIWLSVTPTSRPELPDYANRLEAVTGGWAERFHRFDTTLDRHHPTEAHEWLAILAVAPQIQRRGIGSVLLDGYHQLLDNERMPAYLEASDDGTRQFYLRRGYTDYGAVIRLPEGPSMYPMWRQPQPIEVEVSADDRPAAGPGIPA